jgi:hypothetical protein
LPLLPIPLLLPRLGYLMLLAVVLLPQLPAPLLRVRLAALHGRD